MTTVPRYKQRILQQYTDQQTYKLTTSLWPSFAPTKIWGTKFSEALALNHFEMPEKSHEEIDHTECYPLNVITMKQF